MSSASIESLTRARRDSLYLMLLGTAVFVLFGFALERTARVSTADFRLMYFSAKCLLKQHDPYNEGVLRQTYRDEGGETAEDTPLIRKTEGQYIYLPTAFSITVPFAVLPFAWAQLAWLLATAVSIILAAFLMWEVSLRWAPIVGGVLIALTLANCELFLAIAGPGGIALGLCIAAAWCFIRRRFELWGVFGLAVSLMLKPHDSALVWFSFFLAGGSHRKRALQTLLAVIGLSVPSITWTSYVSPHWVSEFLANLNANGAHGSLSDPGAASAAGHGIVMIISLQTVFSFFYDNPSFYNWTSYLVCIVLLTIWVFRVNALKGVPERDWLVLAPAAALSMLPVYHRLDDAKLLLLVVPACALIWNQDRSTGRIAVAITSTQIILTSAIPWAVILLVVGRIPLPDSNFGRQVLIGLQVMPAPLILLLVTIFYLRRNIYRSPEGAVSAEGD